MVVLLDEIEKAHPDVHEIFFQVFDKGVMEDGEGRSIDFRNTLILLTSNVGTDLVMGMCRDPDLMPEIDEIAKSIRPEAVAANKAWKPRSWKSMGMPRRLPISLARSTSKPSNAPDGVLFSQGGLAG